MERLEPNMLKHDGNYEFHALTYQKSDDDDSTTTVKRILNYLIDDSYKDQILDDMVDNYLNESELFDELYMTIPMLRKMAQKGMLIGGHSMTHRPLSLLSPDEQYQEIHGCLDFLKSNVGETEMESFCYPYGGFHTFTKDTEKILAERGCRCTFNVESRDILESDLRHRPHALPRFDCNEFPHGRASIGMPGRNSTKES
jgi:peptidoglycan/xylan/chitin deacetylase (PgdA/CDA1 family)